MPIHLPVPASQGPEPPPIIVRLPKVRQMTGLGRSTIYRLMSRHMFPSAVRLGPRAVGWLLAEIAEWSAARPRSSY